ncbi:MAG TPA: Crp/Fnr family transcriptional regulator [Clostridiales bacterium]|nr:Crp/Fnr family transcriptional regulator [Clostridiales bacterium]
MKNKIMDEIIKIEGADIEFFKIFFQHANDSFINLCNIKKIAKDIRFITVKEQIDKINILVSGRVKALEEYVTGDIYIFKSFNAPEIFGEMEAVAEIQEFRASLITETECVFVTIPTETYVKYLKNNTDILYTRMQAILKRITKNERENRVYLMLNAIDRIKLYFIHQFECSNSKNVCIIRKTRQIIADETGYSLKTINRVVKKLSQDNLITIEGQKIIINKKQYNEISKNIDEKVNHLKD